MRTTVNPEGKLVTEAQRIARMKGRAALIHEGLAARFEREATGRHAHAVEAAGPASAE